MYLLSKFLLYCISVSQINKLHVTSNSFRTYTPCCRDISRIVEPWRQVKAWQLIVLALLYGFGAWLPEAW